MLFVSEPDGDDAVPFVLLKNVLPLRYVASVLIYLLLRGYNWWFLFDIFCKVNLNINIILNSELMLY
jgi:hypothetical protein